MTAALQRSSRLLLGLLLAVALLLAGPLPAARAASRPVETFVVGLARECFPNVNLNDALAAYRVLLEKIGRRQGYAIRPAVSIYEDTPRFAAAIRGGPMHLAVMDAWQYLELESLPEIRPVYVPAIDENLGRRYLVLVRRGSGLRTLADLQDQPVLRLASLDNNVCRHWLETLLPDDPAHPPADFFTHVETAAKPTAAVLPVFFGQRAACIVDERSFDLMKELNPQVGRSLEIIAASEVFVDIVVCLGEQNWPSPEARADTVHTMGHLDADAAGQQVLTLFKISRQVPFQETHLATVRALRRTYEQRRTARRSEAFAP